MPSKQRQVQKLHPQLVSKLPVPKTVLSHSQTKFSFFPQTLIAGLLCNLVFPVYAQDTFANKLDKNLENPAAIAQNKKSGPAPALIQNNKLLPTIVHAEELNGQPDIFLQLDRNVEIIKGDVNITADTAKYLVVEDQVDASGNIIVKRQRDCYRGDQFRMILEKNQGFVTNATYELEKNNARGKAEKIIFENEQQSTIQSGTYTTCEGLAPDWYLKMDTLKLDTGTDRGSAKDAVLYFKGVPLPMPSFLSFSFPLSSARHSGWLPPTFGQSSKGGFEFGVPYYFNIAPQYDATVLPKVITRRGLQLGVEGRYLGETYAGETAVEGIKDNLKNETRYLFNSTHAQRLFPQLSFSWNVNRASDDDYPADFSNSASKTAQRLLLSDVGFDYYGSIWSASLRSTKYQVLQDITAPIAQPYDRLPQLSIRAAQHDVMGMDWTFDALLTRFWHPTLVRGDRAVVMPKISVPILTPAFYVTPSVSIHATSYRLENPAVGQKSHMQAVAPSITLDSGMVFERKTRLFKEDVTQTLEPRLYYVKTPYRDQSQFPLFDTALADFNFAQIFNENRFTGHDRISDSNQVTAGLVSRYIEESGNERMKFAVGQRFHFNKQKVSLDGTTNPTRTDILIAGQGRLSNQLSIEAALQFNQNEQANVRSNYGIFWTPGPKKILNVQYQFQRDILKQLDVSGQWPLAHRWYVVGKSNYSLQNKKMVEGLAGFEYRADCWAVRFVAHRFATTKLNNNSGFSIQLELNGLARLGVGTNPIETMKRNISGYQSPN